MDLIVTGLVAGAFGTMIMDWLSRGFARAGMISGIDVRMIGRMAAGWAHGRFRYAHPGEIRQVPHEMLFGYVTHYAIGVGLAIPYVLAWELLVGGPASPRWAFVYGLSTTAASWFLVFPSMGLGVCGKRSPEGIRATLSSLLNHLFYGAGLAFAFVLL